MDPTSSTSHSTISSQHAFSKWFEFCKGKPLAEQPWRSRPDLRITGNQLGRGSFSSVWKAVHTVDRRVYAIKQVFVEEAVRTSRGNVDQVFAEVNLLSQIDCPSVVKYITCWLEGTDAEILQNDRKSYDYDSDSSTASSTAPPPPNRNFLFIQMEFCEQTLRQWLENSMESRGPQIPHLLQQLATAVTAIHNLNIIHRDLKPDNIFSKMNRNGEFVWKIGDFGLSVQASLNEDVAIAGAYIYRSPDDNCTTKSDIYSLGLVFLEILSQLSVRTLGGRSMFDEIDYRRNGDFKRVINLVIAETYPRQSYIVCQMLARNPELRLCAQDVLELLVHPSNSPWKKNDHLKVIGNRLGRGCFGKVWKALHLIENRHYAIKQVLVETTLRSRHCRNIEDLLTEAKLLSQITSPHVVKYITSWAEGPDVDVIHGEMDRSSVNSVTSTSDDRNFLFIQMELCDLSTLKKWLIQNNSMETRGPEIRNILTNLASGLDAIHKMNIIHRDLRIDGSRNHTEVTEDLIAMIVYPSERDILRQMLQLNPEDRLGAEIVLQRLHQN